MFSSFLFLWRKNLKIVQKFFIRSSWGKMRVPDRGSVHQGSVFKKKKTVLFFIGPGGIHGESKRYRVFNLVEALNHHGWEGHCVFCDQNFVQPNPERYDIVILFRANFDDRVERLIERFKNAGVPVVFDVDDLIFDPDSAQYTSAVRNNPAAESTVIEYLKSVQRVLLSADYATFSTPLLVEKAARFGVSSFVVKNSINYKQYKLSRIINKPIKLKNRMKFINGLSSGFKKKNKIKIGYFSGFPNSHEIDFSVCSDAVYSIMNKYPNVEFYVVGYLILEKKFEIFCNRVVKKNFMPYLDMLKYLATIDINIAPLEMKNPFTGSKSELKIFEAALVKVPSIVSGVDSYTRVVRQGINGFIANTAQEWESYLSMLVEDQALRTKVAEQAYCDFTKMFFVDEVIKDAISIYEQIIANHRAVSTVTVIKNE